MRFQLIKFYFFTALTFFLIRLVNFFLYHEKAYYKLGLTDTILAFLHGFKFDFSIMFTFYALPTLILLVPWPRQKIFKILIYLAFALLIIMAHLLVFTLLGDLFYFNQVNRHVFDELVTLTGEWDFIIDTLMRGYVLYILVYLALVAVSGFFIMRMFVRNFRRRENWSSFALFLVAAVLIIRGGFGLKPVGIVDAFAYGGSQGGQLALNGVFSAWHATRNRDNVHYPAVNEAQVQELVRVLQLDPERPFFQKYDPYLGAQSKPNIVIVLLESWANAYVRSFGGGPHQVTPRLDAFAAEGLRFKNFYATGSRSIEAIQSILTSFPSLKGLPTLGLGFELMDTAELGTVAADQGYETYFFQSAKRESFRLNSVAAAYGFTHYFGSEDYPKILYPDKQDPAFGWDYEMYMHALNKLGQNNRPFLTFMFTGTTHTPFVKSEKHLFADQHGPENEFGFLNSLNYADWALGEFIDRAKETNWFTNTIFIFTADHSLQTFRKFEFLESFQVPLLIYAPGLIAAGDSYFYGGHLDILPTVFHLIGTKQAVPTVGRSLLQNLDYRYALLSRRYSNPGWVDSEGYVVSDLSKVLEQEFSSTCDSVCQEQRFQWLKNMNALLFQSIKENSWSHRNSKPTIQEDGLQQDSSEEQIVR